MINKKVGINIFYILGFLILVLLIVLKYDKKKVIKDKMDNETTKNSKEIEEYIEYLPHYTLMGNEHEILVNLLNDNRDIWETHLPLTDSFKKKYKNDKLNKDLSIVHFSWSQLQDDSIIYEYKELKDNEFAIFGYDYYNSIYALIYQLDIKNYEINDVKLIDKLLIKDNTGKYSDEVKLKINEKNFMGIFEAIIFPEYYYNKIKTEYNEVPSTSRYNVALTQNFLDKYGYKKDIIANETGVPMSSYELKNGDFEKRLFECVCHYKAKKIWVKYTIEFILSSDGKLDIDDFKIVNKEEKTDVIDNKLYKYNWYILNQVVIKNADWSECPLSDKFYSRYNNKDSIFVEYNVISLKTLPNDIRMFKSNIKYVENKHLYKIILDDFSEKFCLFKIIWNDNYEVDDIITYIVPEDKMNLSYGEMYQLAFND